MNRKILIVYATAGIGHKKASIGVKKALEEIAPKDAEVTLIDALDYTNAFFKWSYLQLYLFMVNRMPLAWGCFYYLTDNCYVNMIISKIRRFSNWINSKKFTGYLLRSKPDVVISTHFFASEVVGDLKEAGLLQTNLITIVTDYRLHSWWMAPGTDMYVVGGEDARNDLLKCNVDPAKVKVLGIPAEPIFSKQLDRKRIFEETGLKEGIFTILVIGGGFGVGPIENIIKIVKELSMPLQVIVVCGHNDSLVKKIVDLKKDTKAHIKVLGFVDNVYEYMEISDILISKAGGITVTESLSKELPMIIIAPIIGQETRNSDFVVSHGASFRIDKLQDLKGLLEDLASHPEKMKKTREDIRAIKKPMACYDIARLALDINEGN
jgi:processive 1,2-diacylglycerol beta-glucosyltransferase